MSKPSRKNREPASITTASRPDQEISSARARSVASIAIAILTLTGAAFLTFWGLGHYALWDDEATTALSAIGVWRTGDTTAVIDHNVVAFEGGIELRNLRFRYMPPLPSYVAAPFVGLLGPTSFAARLPFAIAGFGSVAFLVYWLWTVRAGPWIFGLVSAATLGNVSLFLFSRECRYYSLGILLSLTMAYLYLQWDRYRKPAIVFSILSLCLLASNYLNYVALYACLAVDYLVWGHKHARLQRREWLMLFLPQLALGIPLILTWNPVGLTPGAVQGGAGGKDLIDLVIDKAILLYMNLRDLDQCEFGVTLLILLIPVAFKLTRDMWLIRGSTALLLYIVVTTAVSPQPVIPSMGAAVRYLVPIIPLCILLGAAVVRAICRSRLWLAIPLAGLAFATNALQLYPYFVSERPGMPFFKSEFRSTIYLYVGELLGARTDPFREAAQWINAHSKPLASILVLPKYMTYPLMYHAPGAIYAWQIANPPQPQFQSLSPIHFHGVASPDYLIAFGRFPDVDQFLNEEKARGIDYRLVAVLDVYWYRSHRPELIWRSFKPITDFDRVTDAVYVFERSHD
jgi:hypothetical protein